MDFFNGYIMAAVQIFTGLYFFSKFLKKKEKPVYYLLFAGAGTGMIRWIQAGGTAELAVFVLPLI